MIAQQALEAHSETLLPSLKSIDFKGLWASNFACVVLGLPYMSAGAVLFEDGSGFVFENQSVADDTEPFMTGIDDPFSAAAGFGPPLGRDIESRFLQVDGSPTVFFLPPGRTSVLSFNKAARARLGADLEASNEEIAERFGNHKSGARLLSAIEAAVSDVEDPFFLPKEAQNWTEKQARSAERIARLVIGCFPMDFEGMTITLRATCDVEGRHVDFDGMENAALTNAVFDTLDAAFPGPSAFVGSTWEYNDGPSSRQSGYDQVGGEIAVFDIDTASSNHTRLKACASLRQHLLSLGVSAAMADDLVAQAQDLEP